MQLDLMKIIHNRIPHRQRPPLEGQGDVGVAMAPCVRLSLFYCACLPTKRFVGWSLCICAVSNLLNIKTK